MLPIVKKMFLQRRYYFFLFWTTLLLGILSRKTNIIPLFTGDTLYAIMIYFGMRLILIHKSLKTAFGFALLFCYSIECQQLYKSEWILSIRNTTLGHYILGEGFLWSDLFWYTFGIGIVYFLVSFLKRKTT